MDAVLIEGQQVPREGLRELQQRRDGPSVRRLLAQVGVYLGAAIGLVSVEQPGWMAALVLVSAVVQFGMFGMLHEACHKSAFRRPWASALAGWIAALAQPMSPALMRSFHFQHHRHTHELEGDLELAGLAFMAEWPRGLMWLATMTGIPILAARLAWSPFAALVPPGLARAWQAVLPSVAAERRRRVAWEARARMAVHGGAIAAAILVAPGIVWIYVGMGLGHMFPRSPGTRSRTCTRTSANTSCTASGRCGRTCAAVEHEIERISSLGYRTPRG